MLTFAYNTITPSQLHNIIQTNLNISPSQPLNLSTSHHLNLSPSHHLTTSPSQPKTSPLQHINLTTTTT
ncbi:MAG: hypothetical protein MSA75_06435 [Prevotella sp.]|nr:hypothetical protein [Prevotella sp.]MCI6718562.1 hypothetical protein [Prevotella sp.]MCI7476096.1 hypothetical protein [Prevotella sp.]